MRAGKSEKIKKFTGLMATIFKMAENWFFDHNSVSFKHFCVLFYDLSLYFSQTYTGEMILSDSR
jgi:hypothetical protein